MIEAKLDKGRGPVATVLVKRGTLKRSDIVVAGAAWGRVRALVNERNEQVTSAGPSVPVEILGLDETPDPGDTLAVVENEARARELTEYRQRVKREKTIAPVGGNSLADMMAKLSAKKVSELPVIIKADVQGSAEAIVGSLDKLGTDEVRARIILSMAGAITESDVLLAKGAGAPILGFNVRASKQARDLAEREGVEIRYYAIIYDLLDDIKGVLSGMLAPIQRETFLGNADVLQAFDISKVGKIAGCRVSDGVVRKGAPGADHPSGYCCARTWHFANAQALQRRSQRSGCRSGMRYGVPGLPRHQGRRHHRVLHLGDHPAVPLTDALENGIRRPSLAALSSVRGVHASVCVTRRPSFDFNAGLGEG